MFRIFFAGVPTPSPTTRNSSVDGGAGGAVEGTPGQGAGDSPEDAGGGSTSSLVFGEILSIALGVALVCAIAGIFAARRFILYQREKDSHTLTPRRGGKRDILEAEGAGEEDEMQPGAEPQSKMERQTGTSTRDPAGGSGTPQKDVGTAEMVRQFSEVKYNATIDKRHSMMNVVLGEGEDAVSTGSEDAVSAGSEDTAASAGSEDTASAGSKDAASAGNDDTASASNDDEKSRKSKSDEWFGNPEDIGGFVNQV